MVDLFANTNHMYTIGDILCQMEQNCPIPKSTSKELWKLRHKTDISPHSERRETMLEKSVAMLAQNRHMRDWFNQCPTASGICDSSRNKHSNVDLVRWDESDASARLIELKWTSDDPCKAIQQVLRYGAAYLYCRKHRENLPINDRPIMAARHIALCVLAPVHFYDHGPRLERSFKTAQQGLRQLNSKLDVHRMSLSIEVLAFPKEFTVLPFDNGAEVIQSCNHAELTGTGRQIRDAFNALVTLYS